MNVKLSGFITCSECKSGNCNASAGAIVKTKKGRGFVCAKCLEIRDKKIKSNS